jgi:hypothetical protein
MSTELRLEFAIEQIKLARVHSRRFLDDLAGDEWYWHPAEFTTHIAWQVGHLAVAQYNMCMRRLRGRTNDDEALISDGFIELYQFGSSPVADPEKNAPRAEICRVFEAVHRQALDELPRWTTADLDVPLEQPHPLFKTKFDAVAWCPHHEFIHAGQIALLRRLMGKKPLR